MQKWRIVPIQACLSVVQQARPWPERLSLVQRLRPLASTPDTFATAYNVWHSDTSLSATTAEWSEHAAPLPRPPPEEISNPVVAKTIAEHPDLFRIVTPIKVDVLQHLLLDHPNQPFVASVCTGLREGFWPWANTLDPALCLPTTHDESAQAKRVLNSEKAEFFRHRLEVEQHHGRFSASLGTSLLPGMYCMPMYAVPKPGSTELRLVVDHSAGAFSLNSMIHHDSVTGFPLNNLVHLGEMLIQEHNTRPDLPGELVVWKSDIADAYRLCPMHPCWQIKQAVHIEGKYYID